MTRALVTGASGHIGANLVRELLDRGYQVDALVRITSNLAGLDGLDVRLHHGDILDPLSLDKAMEGVEVLFHAAAVYVNWAADEADILDPAIVGTENVLRAAARHGVRRVVVTSSCNAVGFSDSAESPLDESHWNTELHLPYVRAKVEGERRAWALAKELGLDMVTVLPTGVLGPHDYKITPTTAYLRDAMAGQGPILPGMQNTVHVRDVAIGHVLAAERGRAGERYLLGSESIPHTRMASAIATVSGKSPSILNAPRWLLMAAAAVIETIAGFRGVEPALTTAMIRTAHGRHIYFDITKAREELGFAPRSTEETLADTWNWLVRIGQLSPNLA